MTKDEIKAKLDAAGIEYDGRLGVKKLEALLPQVEEKIELAVEMSKDTRPTTEEILEGSQNHEAGKELRSGIILPHSVIKEMSKKKYEHVMECTPSFCEVYKINERGEKLFVREYSASVHGEKFKELTEQFVAQYR